jgi:ring-1,2-phenylacetyl-CoA epoxidase subunit PaaC
VNTTARFHYLLHQADTALVLAQRNCEWTGHGPVLEQDIAITNIALDGLGAARNCYQQAAAHYNSLSVDAQAALDASLPRTWKAFGRELQEDDLAFLRDEHQYLNVQLAELPRGDWAFTILRQAFLSAFQLLQFRQLERSPDEELAAIAAKSVKEVAYHLRWSSEWVIRLGDGTEESRRRILNALQVLWPFTGELFEAAPYEETAAAEGWAPHPASLQDAWRAQVSAVFEEASLPLPATGWTQRGGKEGRHTEYMGYLLAEMQHLQRTFPNSTW